MRGRAPDPMPAGPPRGRVQVKICGLREPDDAVAVVDAGADFVGVVFAERLRRLRPEQAAEVVGALGGAALAVGVFVDATVDDVLRHRDAVGFGIAQLHGDESPEACAALLEEGLGVWKAIRPRSREELVPGWSRFAGSVDAILVEGFSAAAAGGTGTSFPYEWLGELDRALARLILAGGLDASSVGPAIEAVGPQVVDVSSGVESSPGIKSAALIRRFVTAVRGVAPAGGRYEEARP